VECHLAINLGLRLRKKAEKRKEKGSLYQPDGHPLPVLKHGPRSPLSSRDQKDNTKKRLFLCFLLSDPSFVFVGFSFRCGGVVWCGAHENTFPLPRPPERKKVQKRAKKFTVKAKGKS